MSKATHVCSPAANTVDRRTRSPIASPTPFTKGRDGKSSWCKVHKLTSSKIQGNTAETLHALLSSSGHGCSSPAEAYLSRPSVQPTAWTMRTASPGGADIGVRNLGGGGGARASKIPNSACLCAVAVAPAPVARGLRKRRQRHSCKRASSPCWIQAAGRVLCIERVSGALLVNPSPWTQSLRARQAWPPSHMLCRTLRADERGCRPLTFALKRPPGACRSRAEVQPTAHQETAVAPGWLGAGNQPHTCTLQHRTHLQHTLGTAVQIYMHHSKFSARRCLQIAV
jgi:hypothetical protein